MRKGGGKSKGGTYEHTIIRKLALAFRPLGIQEDDCYRTKNSGATKSQPGDIQFSPHMAELWPVLVECKHYKSIKYSLGKSLSGQGKSNTVRVWWEQVIREQKQRKDKVAILVFRQNNCPDIVCLKASHYEQLCSHSVDSALFTWSMFTYWKKEEIVFLLFDEFLEQAVFRLRQQRKK